MEIIFYILFLCFLVYIYFLPSIIASKRNHKNGLPIALLNLFLGWLFIPWVVALCWSCSVQDVKK